MNLGGGRFRRYIFYDHRWLSTSRYRIYSGQSHPISMSVFQVFIEPCLIYFAFINFSWRQECLRILAVDIISVHVDIVELVILPYGLSLIIKLFRRHIVVYSYIGNCWLIFYYIFLRQVVISWKELRIDIFQSVSLLRILNISLQVLAFLGNFVR